jgi:hypothetical protein
LTTWQVKLNAQGYVAGLQLYNDGTESAFAISADVFQVAWPGVDGGDPQPVFQIANVSGSAKIVWRGDMIGDGTITVGKIAAGAITTVKLDARAITTDKISINGVETDNVLQGAITLPTVAIGSSRSISITTSDQEVTLVSLTTTVVVGTLLIQIMLSPSETTPNNKFPSECALRLLVNGSTVKEAKLTRDVVNVIDGAPIFGYRTAPPFVFLATGVPTGSREVSVHLIVPGVVGPIGAINISEPTLIVTGLHR